MNLENRILILCPFSKTIVLGSPQWYMISQNMGTCLDLQYQTYISSCGANTKSNNRCVLFLLMFVPLLTLIYLPMLIVIVAHRVCSQVKLLMNCLLGMLHYTFGTMKISQHGEIFGQDLLDFSMCIYHTSWGIQKQGLNTYFLQAIKKNVNSLCCLGAQYFQKRIK